VTEPTAVTVVVASHGRHLRLLWLLNALEEQTFAEPWELVVVHDYDPSTASRVIESHPLASRGSLRSLAIPPGTGSPARQRNIGWRAARASLIAFVDDDCRPEPGWLEQLVAGARHNAGAVVQGATSPDPLECRVLRAPHVRTLTVEPVNAYRQTCNILYPRAVLETLSGFDETAITGEDVDLSLRALAQGTPFVPATGAVVFHAIESHTLLGIVRQNLKWRHLAYMVGRHPEFRRDLTLRIFWDPDHLRMTLVLLGFAGARRRRALLALAVPYVAAASRRRGPARSARIIATLEIPGQAIRQAAEVLGLAAGSVRHRTFLL
jgi:glycosyltransferase involved in cell wall biosynthesis